MPGFFLIKFSDNEYPLVIKGTLILFFFADEIIAPIFGFVKGSNPPEIDSAVFSVT